MSRTPMDALPADWMNYATLGVAMVAALFAILAFAAARSSVAAEALAQSSRAEAEATRAAVETSARGLRQELGQALHHQHAAVTDRIVKSSDALRDTIEERLDATVAAQAASARETREELDAGFQRMRSGVGDTLRDMSDQQKERLDGTKQSIDALSQKLAAQSETLRQSVENRLDVLRTENAAKLDEMRATVDEKLQTTLEARLGESFKSVVEHLNRAYEVFGEMRTISANVGDLKNVLTNPKLRGTFGEVQLAMLLQDFLAPSQYVKDAQVRDHSGERVEYAIRLPSADGEEVLLPVDAKFPREDHEHMVKAIEDGDPALEQHFRKQLENRIKNFAKDIARKYINPPRTTERAILFLPTESLFAEVLRQPGLFDHLQRECGVILAGPTTFAAILHAFQINHRSMALATRSTEIWKTLSAVKGEFHKYNDTVVKVTTQLRTVSNSMDALGTRTRAMNRVLKTIELLPEDGNDLLALAAAENAAEEGSPFESNETDALPFDNAPAYRKTSAA